MCPAYQTYDAGRRQLQETNPPDTGLLPILCELDDEKKAGDEDEWEKINPMLGISIDIKAYRDAWKKVQRERDTMATFLRLWCGRWAGQVGGWDKMNSDHFKECIEDATLTYDGIKSLEGHRAWVGCDPSTANDLTGYCVIVETGELNDKGKPLYVAFLRMYVCNGIKNNLAQKQKVDMLDYKAWIAEGELRHHNAKYIDLDAVIRDLAKDVVGLDVQAFAVDNGNRREVVNAMQEYCPDIPIVYHPTTAKANINDPQKLNINRSIVAAEMLVEEERITVIPNRLLRYGFGVVKFGGEGSYRTFDKARGRKKQDAVDCFTFGCGATRLEVEKEEPLKPNVFTGKDYDEVVDMLDEAGI